MSTRFSTYTYSILYYSRIVVYRKIGHTYIVGERVINFNILRLVFQTKITSPGYEI